MQHSAVIHTPVLLSPSLASRLSLALAYRGQRLWQALCAQAERPTRRVPRY